MAFSRAGLCRIGGSGDSRPVFVYASTDAELAAGDIVLIVDTDAPAVTISFVASNAAGVVDLASGTAIANA